jgi:hypothetical protein
MMESAMDKGIFGISLAFWLIGVSIGFNSVLMESSIA